jgi:cobalamin biosynthesis protein CbiG
MLSECLKGVVFPDGNIDIKKLGDTIKWVVSDVLKDNNLEPKDIGKYVAAKVKKMFFAEYNKF